MSGGLDRRIIREEDRRTFEEELESFVPNKVFDAHAHLYTPEHYKGKPKLLGRAEFVELTGKILPGREVGALFIPMVFKPRLVQSGNEFISENATGGSNCFGALMVTPKDDPEKVRSEVRRLNARALKCYHLFSGVKPSWEAEIPDYLPESLVKIADDESLAIVLHMVRSTAVADESNIKWIRHYCQTYPNMKLILAHSARAFQPALAFKGLPQLTGLDNLYFDCSANCEPISHQAIIRIMGHKKMLFGTDIPVSIFRGRSLGVSDSFIWLYEDSPVWNPDYKQIKPLLVCIEHLRSLKYACWSEKLTDSQVEDIFWNNAAELFGVK